MAKEKKNGFSKTLWQVPNDMFHSRTHRRTINFHFRVTRHLLLANSKHRPLTIRFLFLEKLGRFHFRQFCGETMRGPERHHSPHRSSSLISLDLTPGRPKTRSIFVCSRRFSGSNYDARFKQQLTRDYRISNATNFTKLSLFVSHSFVLELKVSRETKRTEKT